MESATNLKVVRIPYNVSEASPICLTNIPLIAAGSEGLNKGQYKDFEKELGRIPNMQLFNDPQTFSWADRSLSQVSNVRMGIGAKADYMMYVCRKEGGRLPPNEYVQKTLRGSFEKGRGTSTDPSVVYGDAFIFKKEPELEGSEKSEGARYIDMHKGFVKSAQGAYLAKGILEKLLISPPKEEKATGGGWNYM
ncbi:MAG: hypothetical protein ASARMPREDX12_007482 [Alectoria sarmentosa]|nr:MAG: hypothetical protein ASARMPREDX12_007482 [Alectoria sarmentosa]